MDLCSVGAKHPSDAQGRNNALAVDVKAGDLDVGRAGVNLQPPGGGGGRGRDSKVWMDNYMLYVFLHGKNRIIKNDNDF